MTIHSSTGPAFDEALDRVRRVSDAFRGDWWIIGSAAARLAGADVDRIGDVDLLLSGTDISTLATRLGLASLSPPKSGTLFRSKAFARILPENWPKDFGSKTRPLPVEAMSNLDIRSPDGTWHRLRPQTRQNINGLFVPDIAEQIAMLSLMNREKDQPRIRALKAIAQ